MSQPIRSYSLYTPSPVPWLEDVPSEWRAIRLDRLFRYRNEEPIESDGRVTGYLDGRVTLRSNVAGQKIKGVVHETGWQRIHVGDFAISGMNAHLGGMGVSDSEGKCSPIYMVLEPLPDTNAHFVSLAVRHAAHLGAIKALVQTIRFNSADMKRADLKKIFVPVPSRTEQEQIVRFVRQLDSRVNRLIKAKRRLIELLHEQKQVIIHQAVTRGLDPTVPLKPSGIDWLGDVPRHWNLKRFKFVTRITSGQVDPQVAPFRDMVLVAPNHIEKVSGLLVGRETADEQGADSGKYLVKRGQVIYSKIRPNLQKATIAQEDCLCSADMYPIQTLARELSQEYLLMLMLSEPFTQYVVDCSMRVAMPKVNRDALGNGWLWYPNLESQAQILNYISSEGAPFDDAVSKARSEIDLIREYRTGLVADVVTGQLDVRQHPWANTEIEDPVIAETELEGDELSEDSEELEEVEA